MRYAIFHRRPASTTAAFVVAPSVVALALLFASPVVARTYVFNYPRVAGPAQISYKPATLRFPPIAIEGYDETSFPYVSEMTWRRWGGPQAEGVGRLLVDGGDYPSRRVRGTRVSLTRRVRSGCSDSAGTGPWAYSRAILRVPGYRNPIVVPQLQGC
jgi:hypothetical protein